MALRSHHAILYASLGSAASARSDEQPSLGVHPKRVQRERGPVQLHTPAPTHPARAFTVSSAEPTTCRAPPLKAAELGAAAAGKTADPFQARGFATTQTTDLRSRDRLGRADAECARAALLGSLRASAGRQSASALAGLVATELWLRIRFLTSKDRRSAIFVWGMRGGAGRDYGRSVNLELRTCQIGTAPIS